VEQLTVSRCAAPWKNCPGDAEIFDLHEVEGYQHHEIAELLQCYIGNSKSQLNKAKLKMRGLLFPQRRILR